MLLWLLAGVALLLAGLWLGRWIIAAEPKLLAFALKSAGGVVVAVGVGFLLLTGRGAWMFGLLPFLLPMLLRRWNGLFGSVGSAGGSSPAASVVGSRFFEMRLEHATGDLDGDVREGRHAGRLLSDLSLAELVALAAEIRGIDRDSDRLLEAYLDRRDARWRTQAGAEGASGAGEGNHAGPSSMTAKEAYRVLGLPEGAGEAEIREAYHRLIGGVHPDRGGSSFLAAQVNRAKDVLLGRPPMS